MSSHDVKSASSTDCLPARRTTKRTAERRPMGGHLDLDGAIYTLLTQQNGGVFTFAGATRHSLPASFWRAINATVSACRAEGADRHPSKGPLTFRTWSPSRSRRGRALRDGPTGPGPCQVQNGSNSKVEPGSEANGTPVVAAGPLSFADPDLTQAPNISPRRTARRGAGRRGAVAPARPLLDATCTAESWPATPPDERAPSGQHALRLRARGQHGRACALARRLRVELPSPREARPAARGGAVHILAAMHFFDKIGFGRRYSRKCNAQTVLGVTILDVSCASSHFL